MTLTEKIVGVLAILAFILITGVAKAEDKTITPQEFVSNVAEVPGKLVKFIGNEVDKTKEYQSKSWADMKTKWPFTMLKGKSDVAQD
jgi:hypothetical protein